MGIKRKWEGGPGQRDRWKLHHLTFIAGWLQAKGIVECGWVMDSCLEGGVALGGGNNHWLFIRDGGSSIELVSRYKTATPNPLAEKISNEIQALWLKGAQGNV